MTDDRALRLRLRQSIANPNVLEVQDAVIKKGPRAFKTAVMFTIGPQATGEVKKRVLRLQTWVRAAAGGDYEEKAGLHSWSCEGEEIEALQALLGEHLPESGTYTLVKDRSPAASIARLLANEDAATTADAIARLMAIPGVRDALVGSDTAASGAALVTAQRQRQALRILEERVLDPNSSEGHLQDALNGQWWLFGGRHIGQHHRRLLTVRDQVDIPLIRPDGSLHIVELKRAKIPKLIYVEHEHLAVGADVHKAVSQGMNYLRSLDENQAQIRQDLKVDVRRAAVTVVIGHPAFVPDHDEEEIAQTLRTYNSHLARIEVITYADLIVGAKAALDLAVPEIESRLKRDTIVLPDRQPVSDQGPAVSSPQAVKPRPNPWATSDPWAVSDSEPPDDPWAATTTTVNSDPWATSPSAAGPSPGRVASTGTDQTVGRP